MLTATAPLRRILWPMALLAGLVAAEAALAATADEAAAAAAIARRSFGSAETASLLQRSAPTAPARRQQAPQRPRYRTVAPAPVPRHGVALDPSRAERTARFRVLIEHHSRLHHVDAELVEAIVYTESGGDERAVSTAGARGLMQLMPATARQLGVDDPFSPEQSIRGGVRHLRDLLDRYGAAELALWAYNAGSGAVGRGHLPRETADYVPRVLAVRRALLAQADTEAVRR